MTETKKQGFLNLDGGRNIFLSNSIINIFVCLVKSLSLLQKIKTLSVTTLLVTKATTHLIL